MKHIFFILAFVGVLLQNFNKIIIYADFKLNRDYIATNLCVKKEEANNCCKGKCHLQKQLEKEEKKERAPINRLKEKNEIQLFSETRITPFFFTPSVAKKVSSVYLFSLSENHLRSVFHPPKVQLFYLLPIGKVYSCQEAFMHILLLLN